MNIRKARLFLLLSKPKISIATVIKTHPCQSFYPGFYIVFQNISAVSLGKQANERVATNCFLKTLFYQISPTTARIRTKTTQKKEKPINLFLFRKGVHITFLFITRKRSIKVKPTGSTGGLHRPYKGLLPA